MGIAHARAGEVSQAEALHEELVARSPADTGGLTVLAGLSGELGKIEQAFELLERAYDVRDTWLTFLRHGHYFDSLRGDPRLDEMIRRTGIG